MALVDRAVGAAVVDVEPSRAPVGRALGGPSPRRGKPGDRRKSVTSTEGAIGCLSWVGFWGEGFLLDVVLGIVGAIVGGYLFALVGAEGITGFNPYSMVVAVIGAVIVLVGYHALTGSRAI